MAKITRKKVCPTCGGDDFSRIHRSFWMHWFHGSRLFICRHCRERILLLKQADDKSDGGDQA